MSCFKIKSLCEKYGLTLAGSSSATRRQRRGIETDQNGLTSLYTRAVDVARIDEVISCGNDADNCAQTDYYNISDATWRNMQSEIEQWIQENNGVSRTQNPIALKVDSAKILAVLKGDTIADGINCN